MNLFYKSRIYINCPRLFGCRMCFSVIIEYLGQHPKNITAIIVVAITHVLLYLNNLLKNYKLIPLCHTQKIKIEF